MNILGETWTCEHLRCLARDRKSAPKFHYTTWHQVTMLMFSQELIWTREICYTNVVVSGLILKMRSEDTFLEKWCISLPFHSVTLATKADHEAAENFVCHPEPSSNDSEKWSSLYANWLRSILYIYLLTFGKLTSMAIVTTGAFPVVTVLFHRTFFLQLFVVVLRVGDFFKKSFTDQSVIKDLFGKWTIFNKPWRLWQNVLPLSQGFRWTTFMKTSFTILPNNLAPLSSRRS